VDPGVAVPGSKTAVLGTNPLAYAVPAGKERTVFLDIATSVVAAGKVYTAQAVGEKIPEGWLLDAEGLPTTDPSGYPRVGALLPMAGHKGYGIALMIEILAGVLNGGAFGKDVVSWVKGGEPVNQSFSFIAIDVGVFMPVDEFRRRMDHLIQEIRGAPKARGTERIYLPGEKEWEKRERAQKEGLSLPPDVLASLQGLAEDHVMDMADLFRNIDTTRSENIL
jgi:LDH2 family malate/lactate/ureidoglycolate dehydrogenase